MAQDAQLLLKVGLDLSTFRSQLATLGQAAAGYNLPIKLKFDRTVIKNELNNLQRFLGRKKFNIELNIVGGLTKDQFEKIQTRLDALSKTKAVEIPVSIRSAVTQKDVLSVVSGINKTIKGSPALENAGGKIRIGTSIKPSITQADVRAFKKAVTESLGGISVNVKANVQGGKGGMPPGFPDLMEYMRTQGMVGKTASGMEMRMRNEPGGGQLERVLDTFARGVFRMLGMDPAMIRAQEAEKRRLPSINWEAMVPPSRGVSTTSTMALAAGRDFPRLPGSAFTEQKRLVGDILDPALKEALRNAANAFVDSVRNGLNAAIRGVQVKDLGNAGRPMLAAGRTPAIAGLLPPAGGTTPRGATRFNVVSTGAVVGNQPFMRAPAVPPSKGGGIGGGGGGGGGGLRPSGGGDFFGGLGRLSLPGAGIIRELGSEFAFATKQVLLFGQAYKLLGFAQDFPAQVGQAVGELQSFRNTLKAITPTAQEAAKSNALILDLVSKYNVPLESARGGFTKLYASMQPAGFAGEEVRDLFTGISKAAATFGMSSDKVDRVTYAFAQMASKGQVMSEELKGQLGDVLPGAMALFAEAAGFEGPNAIAQFSKALEDGAYKGQAMKDLLNNVTILLNQKFSEGAKGAANTFQGSMNNMRNSLKGFYESFEPIAVQFLNNFVAPLSQGLKDATDGINAFFTGTQAKTSGGIAIANELKQLQPALQGIQNNIKQILPVFGQLIKIALEVGKIFLSVAGSPLTGYLVRVYAVVLPVITAFGILRTAVVAMLGPLGLFNAQMLLGVGRFTAFRNTMALTGATAAQTATAIRGVNAALTGLVARTGIGLAIIGLGMLAERFLSAGAAAQTARQKMLQFADAVKALGEAGDVAGVTVELTEQKGLAARIKRAQTLLSDLRAGKKSVSPQQAEELQALGLSSNMAFVQEGGQRNLTVQTMPGAISANLGAAQRGYLEAQTKIVQAERALTRAKQQRVETEKGLSKIQEEPDTKGAAKEESAYNQLLQEQLQKQNEINAIGKDELSQLEAKRVLAGQLLKLRLDEINRTQTGRVRDLARSNELLEYKKIVAETDEEWKNITKEISEAATKAQELFDKIYKQDTPEMTPLQKALGDIKKETIDNIQAIDELLNYVNKRVGARPEYKALVTSLTQMRGERAGMTPAQQATAAGVRVTRDIVKDLRSELQTGAQAFAPSSTLAGVQARLGPDWMQLSGQRQAEITQLAEQVDLMKPFIDMAQAIKTSREELQKLIDTRYQIVPMAQTIGSAFGESFKGIASGSVTAQQALVNFFQSVGSSFLDMAGRMIAKWMEMQIIGLAASLIPGMGGFFGGGARVGQSVGLPSGVGIGAGGGILQNPMGQGFGTFGPNFGIRQFANGGLVTGPTMGLVGEGRFNEAIVPLPNGKSIPVELGGSAGNQIVSNITVNVNNGQMQSNGGASSAELTRKLEGAVKQVIIGELRPGGVLSGRG